MLVSDYRIGVAYVHVNIASAAGFHIFGTKSVLVWGPWWEWGIPICVGVSRGCSGGVRGGGTLVQAYQFEPNNACESEAYPVCNKFDRILAGSFYLESLAMTLVNQIWQCLWAWVLSIHWRMQPPVRNYLLLETASLVLSHKVQSKDIWRHGYALIEENFSFFFNEPFPPSHNSNKLVNYFCWFLNQFYVDSSCEWIGKSACAQKIQ